MNLKEYIGCNDNDNPILCYFTKYLPKTWSIWSIAILLLFIVLNLNKKIIFFALCAVILNSIFGFILIQFMARKNIMEIFNISYPVLIFYDILVHIIPLILIFKYYSPPKISKKELITGFIILSASLLLYDKIIGIDKIYLSISTLKLSKIIHILLYLSSYLLLITLYKK